MLKSLVIPVSASLVLHGLILFVLIFDWQQQPMVIKPPAPSFVRAELVVLEKPKAKPVAPKPSESAAQQAEKKRQQALEEQKRQQQLKQQQAEKERQLALQKQREKEQQQRQQAAEKERQEQQRREREQRLQREAEQELADAIAQEQAQQQASTDAEMANSYIAVISAAITRNWSRPPSARNNMEAELVIALVPTGEVVSVKVVKGSGNAAFDRSAESAVRKAARFPELQDLPPRVFEKYFRQLRLKFRPEDLRL